MIGKRISDLSSSKEIFTSEAPFYNQALSAAGYKEKIAVPGASGQLQEEEEKEGYLVQPALER